MVGAVARVWPLTGVAVVLTALLLLTTTPTSADVVEPQMLGTMPAQDGEVERPPGQARVVFDAAVDPATVALGVDDEAGERVDGDDAGIGAGPSTIEVSLPADLPAGTYTATWRAGFDDAAELEGSWQFHVLEDPEPDEDPRGGGRAVVILVALLLLAGAAVAVWFARSRLARR